MRFLNWRRGTKAAGLLAVLLIGGTATAVNTEPSSSSAPVTSGVANSAAPPTSPPPAQGGPEFAIPTRLDAMGRVLAPVMVNGQGPFRFILDTGANRSVLSPHLLDILKLTLDANSKINVHGVTGSAVLPAVHLDRLQAGALTLARDTLVPVLAQTVLARADGILGVDGLKMARIEIDFAKDKVRIIPATGRQSAPSGYLTIPADISHGSLLTVPAKVGHITARAIIDTGAERTLGNNALREALLLSRRHGVEEQGTTVFGATPDISVGTSISAPTIYIGEAELHNLVITFGDLHVFEMWGLERQPALLIGMDLLGSVERLIIDYRREELQVKPRS